MAKEVVDYIKLQIPAGSANPSPPIGPALGQRGLNIMEFCKAFNDATKDKEKGMPIPVVITAYKDRTFSFITKLPPVSYLLMKEAKIQKGAKTTGKEFVGKVSWDQVVKVATTKMQDLNANDVEAAARMVAGTATSMGLEVTGKPNKEAA